MSRHVASLVMFTALAGVDAAPVGAQTRPAPIVEAVAGWAGFVDENWIDRAMVGVGGRMFVTGRMAAGPERSLYRSLRLRRRLSRGGTPRNA